MCVCVLCLATSTLVMKVPQNNTWQQHALGISLLTPNAGGGVAAAAADVVVVVEAMLRHLLTDSTSTGVHHRVHLPFECRNLCMCVLHPCIPMLIALFNR